MAKEYKVTVDQDRVAAELLRRARITVVILRTFALSVAALLLITLGEHLTAVAMPRTFAGFFWGPVSIVVWVVLVLRFVAQTRRYQASTVVAVASALFIGAVSGFVGALAGWVMYATGHGAPFIYIGGIGSTKMYGFEDGIVMWATIGAAVCGTICLIGYGMAGAFGRKS